MTGEQGEHNEQKPTVTFREMVNGLRQLGLDRARPVIAHASLASFGEVRGGAETVLGAIFGLVDALVMPVFTFKTMITPEDGPENNAIQYGSGKDTNQMAEFFKPGMPADRMMGAVAEALRQRSAVRRSSHPILSFAGYRADPAIEAQTMAEPLAPVGVLAEQGGWVLLLGVDHTVNTSIHYAEKLSGRKQFIRWALTPEGVRECPGFPGCSDGFQALAPLVEGITRRAQIGTALVQALPLKEMITIVKNKLAAEPQALLCGRADCERCNAVRGELIES